jgi:hypothetical protein
LIDLDSWTGIRFDPPKHTINTRCKNKISKFHILTRYDSVGSNRKGLWLITDVVSGGKAARPGLTKCLDHIAQVHRRDALAGVNNQIHGQQPFPQRQLGRVHGRFGCYGKINALMTTAYIKSADTDENRNILFLLSL